MKYVEPEETWDKITEAIVKGLHRAITEEEAKAIFWLKDAGYESRVPLAKLFSEMAARIKELEEE